MKKIKRLIILVLISFSSIAQQQLSVAPDPIQQYIADSLRKTLKSARNDSVRYEMTGKLRNFFFDKNKDSAFFYTKLAADISRNSGKYLAEADMQMPLMYHYQRSGDLANAYQSIMKALEIAEDPQNEKT